MAKGINVAITKGAGGDPVSYALSRNIDGAGWTVIQATLAYTASPQTYSDQGNFSDDASVQYRATATNADGTSSNATVQTLVVSGGGATNYIVRTSITPDEDKITFGTTGGRVQLPHTANWVQRLKMAHIGSLTQKTLTYGAPNNTWAWPSNNDIDYTDSVGGKCTWSSTVVSLTDGTTTVGDILSAKGEIDMKISWTVSDGANGLKMSLNNHDFGFPNINPYAMTQQVEPFNIGHTSIKEAWDIDEVELSTEATTYLWLLNEGSGSVSTSEAGAKEIVLSTLNAGGQTHIDDNMWNVHP